MKIKNIITTLSLSFLGFALIGCSTSSTDIYDYEKVKTIEISQPTYIGGFNDLKYGITVGYAGEVHYSEDGGKTWPKGENTSYCRFGLDIVDKNISWNCGNSGHVRKTTDGGKTWVKVTDFGKSEPNQCRYLSFLDDTTGWIASPYILGATFDGGSTWETIILPDDMADILAINLLNEKIGFIVDTNGSLYKTNNGGNSFTKVDLNLGKFNNQIYSTNAFVFRFTDENTGTFFYYDENDSLKCIYTDDGGKSFTKKNIPKTDAFGPLYLSHDCKYLTVNSDLSTKLYIFKSK